MKKVLLCLFLLGMSFSYAQQTHLGIKAGVNFAKLTGDQAEDLENKTGYHIGVTAELGLTSKFSVQPEILYSTQGAKFEDEDLDINYVNVPVLAKFYLIKNVSFQVGPQFGYVIGNGDTFDEGIKDFDLSGAAGVEVRILSFFAQARYNFGLTDVADVAARNAVFQISVGYNFL